MAALKIGDILWRFEAERRVYSQAGGAPIYREKFVPHEIVAETKVSWLCRPKNWTADHRAGGASCWPPYKVKKASLKSSNGSGWGQSQWHTTESMEANVWIEANRARLHLDILRCSNPAVLQAIDALLTGKANP